MDPSNQQLAPQEELLKHKISEQNHQMRRKLGDSVDCPKKRIAVKVYVKDINEIPDLRKRVKELEKNEIMYKARITELENQISSFTALHSQKDQQYTKALPIPVQHNSLFDGHSRTQVPNLSQRSSNGLMIPVASPESEYERFPSIRKTASDRTRLLALYDYTPSDETTGRLAFKEGEVLYLVSMKTSDGWWKAEINGKSGKIPSNYVEQLDPSKAFKVRVTKNFDAQQFGDMSIQRGQLVTVLKRQDNGWYLGEKGGKTGFFPNTHVERVTKTPHS